MLGSEIERPERNLPLNTITGSAAMIGIYLLAELGVFLGAECAGSRRQ